MQLRPKGREHVGLCPFHNDRTPSLAVVSHKGSGFYKCFACGAAGNAIDFMINYHRMDFPEALRHLAQRAGIEIQTGPRIASGGDERADSPSSLRRANEAAQRFFRRSLESEAGAAARGIISGRGISPEMSERFGLGVAPAGSDALVQYVDRLARHSAAASGRDGARASGPRDGARRGDDQPTDEATVRGAFEAAGLVRHRGGHLVDGFRNRITFPICDELGRVIAFGARKIDPEDEPKYLNSPESAIFHKSRALYALHLAKRAIVDSRTAIVVEGYTDVIACHAAGITNVVATLGTSLTRDHARILQRLCDTVVLLFDGDEAGQRAADRALEVFFSATIDVRICTLPDALDPDDLLRQPGGAERFSAAVDESPDALAHLVSRFTAALSERQGVTPRQRAIEAMLQRLAAMGLGELAPLRRRLVLEAIARAAGLPLAEIERAVPAVRARRADADRADAGRGGSGVDSVGRDSSDRDDEHRAENGRDDSGADDATRGDAGRDAPRVRTPLPRALVEAESTLVGLVLAWPECALRSRCDAGRSRQFRVERYPRATGRGRQPRDRGGHRAVPRCGFQARRGRTADARAGAVPRCRRRARARFRGCARPRPRPHARICACARASHDAGAACRASPVHSPGRPARWRHSPYGTEQCVMHALTCHTVMSPRFATAAGLAPAKEPHQ